MSILALFSKIEAFAAMTPTEPREIDGLLKLIVATMKQQFQAYLIDIVWEMGQGHGTKLKVVMMDETEEHGYRSRPVYDTHNGENRPNSLTAWCYANDEPVWIASRAGLLRENQYDNRWDEESKPIPADTIYQYNRAKICTEICYPLRTHPEEWRRVAGVLNIESRKFILPSGRSRSFVRSAASVIEQLQTQKLAHKAAREYSHIKIKEIDELKATLTEDEPGFVPCAFVALPMSTSGAGTLGKWIDEVLTSRGFECSWPETNGDIRKKIWSNIRESHLGIVVSTGFNRNVNLEWGYLLGTGKPVIRLHAPGGDGEADPFDIQGTKTWRLHHPGEDLTETAVKSVLNAALDALFKENQELADLVGFEFRTSEGA